MKRNPDLLRIPVHREKNLKQRIRSAHALMEPQDGMLILCASDDICAWVMHQIGLSE